MAARGAGDGARQTGTAGRKPDRHGRGPDGARQRADLRRLGADRPRHHRHRPRFFRPFPPDGAGVWAPKAIATGFLLIGIFVFISSERRACQVLEWLKVPEGKEAPRRAEGWRVGEEWGNTGGAGGWPEY